jgi:hypothetical protein
MALCTRPTKQLREPTPSMLGAVRPRHTPGPTWQGSDDCHMSARPLGCTQPGLRGKPLNPSLRPHLGRAHPVSGVHTDPQCLAGGAPRSHPAHDKQSVIESHTAASGHAPSTAKVCRK